MSRPNDFSVRPAVSGDLDAIAQVWRESALSMQGEPDVPPLDVLRSRIDAELRSGWELHVAERGGRIIGMLAIKPVAALLDQIFVTPAEQGKGVGRALLKLAQLRLPAGFTLRMAASNERARRFYEKEGLRWVGDGVHPWSGVPVSYYRWEAS